LQSIRLLASVRQQSLRESQAPTTTATEQSKITKQKALRTQFEKGQ